MLEKGKGKEFKGKTLNEIEMEKDIYYSSESCEEDEQERKEEGVTHVDSDDKQEKGQKEVNGEGDESQNEKKSLLAKKMEIRKKLILRKKQKSTKKSARSSEKIELLKELNDINNMKEKTYKPIHKVSAEISGRIRWTDNEKKIVLDYFKHHVKNKVTPKKHECDDFLEKHGKYLPNKDWVRVKTLVYNKFRLK